MKVFEKLQQIKEMIRELVVSWTIILSKSIVDDSNNLSKHQAFVAISKAIKINFTRNLDLLAGATKCPIIEEAKETVLDFSEGTVKAF